MKHFLLLALLLSLPAVAAEPIKTGTFQQKKQLAGLSRSLNSNGRFAITENEVLWITTTPLFSEVQISGDSVSERYTPDGEFQITAQGDSVTTVSRVLALIVQNDIDGLSRYFTVQQQGHSNRLTPSSTALKKLFSEITIREAGDTVDVNIIEAAGSTTHIRLQPGR